jgi:trigger factor
LQLLTAKQPGSQLDLTFQLDAQDVQKTFAKVYSELATRGQIPGFRPGKAPAAVIKRRYKSEVLRDMFWMTVVEDYVEKELEKEELEVLGEPEFPDFHEQEVSEDAPVEFTIKVSVKPEPQLPDYSGLKLHRLSAEVTEEQVARVIEDMRNAVATEQPVAGRDTVENGDIVEAEVVVQLAETDEPGEAVLEVFEIGSERYEPAIDEALVGQALESTVELPVEYPEDHEDDELAGKSGTVRATIKSIATRVLPELDDAFAQAQGEYEGLDDLRAKLRANLEAEATRHSHQTLENDALGAVVRGTVIDMPERLVDEVARHSFRSFMAELQQAGLTLEQFEQIATVEDGLLLANERVRAEAGLKVNFALEALAKAEGIEVDDAAVAEETATFAVENALDEDFVTRSLDLQEGFRDQITDRARRRLTIAAVLAKAEIEEVSAERYAEIKEEERQAREAEAVAKAEAEAAAKAEAEAAALAEAEAAAKAEAEAAAQAEAEAAEAAPSEEAPEADEAASSEAATVEPEAAADSEAGEPPAEPEAAVEPEPEPAVEPEPEPAAEAEPEPAAEAEPEPAAEAEPTADAADESPSQS